ncbi:hypothetical protein D3C87_255730 [compost metagenome]
MGLQHITPLPFKALFPDEEPKELIEYLKGIDKEFLKKTGTFFLGLHHKGSKWAEPKDFISQFFSYLNEDFGNEMLNRINALGKHRYNIPYEISSLKLFEFVFDNDIPQGDILSQKEQEVKLFKAYLLLNQLNTIRANEITAESIDDVSDDIKPAAVLIANHFHNFDLTNYEIDKLFSTQIIKAISLFEFLEREDSASPLLRKFYRDFGVTGYRDFLRRLIPISASIATKDKESFTDIDVSDNEELAANIEFLNKLTVQDTSKVEDLDFKGLRAKPLYRVTGSVYRIISPLFALELLFNGLFWKLKETNDSLSDNEKIKNFNTLKTSKFSEAFILHKVLKRYFGQRYLQLSGEELDDKYEGAPDYYVRNGKRVFLFESKDILVPAKVKESTDFHVIEKAIADKLYKPKGIMQIISNIRKSLTSSQPFDTSAKGKNLIIHPVMVLHQRMFMTAGMNKMLNFWFQDELKKLQQEGVDISNVKPLVIIDIDTLIFNQDVFISGRLNLEDCLVEYQKEYLNFTVAGKKYHSQQDATDALIDSYLPFSHYLDVKIDKLGLRDIPNELMEKGYTLFD